MLDAFITGPISKANTIIRDAWSNVHYILTYGEKQEWKIYFVRFTCKRTKISFYKFGVTTHQNVVNRFDPEFEGNSGWKDFDIKPIGSFKVPGKYTQAEVEEKYEKIFQARFPKNIWLEKYLGFGNYDGLSGITEIVALYEGNREGDISPRKEVTLYSYREARNFFYNIKDLVENNQPLPHILPIKRRCTQAASLDIEEVLGADM